MPRRSHPDIGCPTRGTFTRGLPRPAQACSSVTDKSLLFCYIIPMPTNLHRVVSYEHRTLPLHRYYGAGYSHFITRSCYQRRPLLGIPRARDLFLEVMEQVRQRHQFVIVGYVVMPEHVHLLFSEPERGNPSLVLAALKQSFAHRLLRELHAQNVAQADALWSTPSPWDMFGNIASTILLYSARRSAWKSCATCTAILCSEV